MIKSKFSNNTLTIFLHGKLDSSNANEMQEAILKEIQKHPQCEILIDARNLTYLSSAGLRVFLSLGKFYKVQEIINLSPEIYEIFDSTGFNRIFKTRKVLGKVRIDGMQELGHGVSGSVYRLSDDEIIKVYFEHWDLDRVEKERDIAQQSFVNGVDTAISYDIVEVGNRYGVVYEMIKADTLENVLLGLQNDEEKLKKIAREYALFVKKQNNVEITGAFADMKARCIEDVKKADFLPEDIRSLLLKEMEHIPEKRSFVHGDCHPGNVMYKEGEFFLIDMEDASFGHSAFDIGRIYFLMKILPDITREVGPKKLPDCVWDTFVRTYYDTDQEDELASYQKILGIFGMIRDVAKANMGPEKIKIQEKIVSYLVQYLRDNLQAGSLNCMAYT